MQQKAPSDLAKDMLKKADPKMREALRDLIARSPKKISVEVEFAEDKTGDDPWSGNIYKYSF